MQHVLQQVSIIAANVYDAGKSCDEGFSHEALALVQESAIAPLRKKKPDLETKAKPKTRKPQKTPPQDSETPPRRSLRQNTTPEQPIMQCGGCPPPIGTSLSAKMPILTPSKKGNAWKTTWASIAKDLTPATKKIAGHMLDQVFSHQGVQDALEMAEQVTINHEVMELDAAAISTIRIGALQNVLDSLQGGHKSIIYSLSFPHLALPLSRMFSEEHHMTMQYIIDRKSGFLTTKL